MLACLPLRAQWRSIAGFGDQSVAAMINADEAGLFVALRNKTVLRSDDDGGTWSRRDFGIADTEQIYSFTEHDGALIAATYRGALFRSTDAGAVWVLLSRQSDAPTVNLVFSYGAYLWLATSNQAVLRSLDGVQWTAAQKGLREGDAVLAMAVHANDLYAGTSTGVARWSESAQSWQYISDGLTGRRVFSLQSAADNLYAGSDADGIYVRTPELSFWQKLSTGFSGGAAVADLSPVGGSVAAATLGGEVVVWEPFLQSWHNIAAGLPTGLQPAVLMTSGTTLYVGGVGKGLYSRDLRNVVLDVDESSRDAAPQVRMHCAGSQVSVVNSGVSGQVFELEVFSLRGVSVAGEKVRVAAGESKLVELPRSLAAGVYLVRLRGAAANLSGAIVVGR